VQPNPCSFSETAIGNHARCLPAEVVVIAGPPAIEGRPVWSGTLVARAWRKALRIVRGRDWYDDLTTAYLKVFRHYRPEAVLAEYGPTGADVVDACRRAGIPLIVHFHGYDASERQTLEEEKDRYPVLCRAAAAIIAVSHSMRRVLIELGAFAEKVHWNPCGVDCTAFRGGAPAEAPPVFIAVGRFCEKKAPDLTLQAFAEVLRSFPDARLRMVGAGPLMGASAQRARDLGIAEAVTILGACPPPVVQEELRRARCFVQHSVVAANGDSEGTPATVLEAGASGLPVISTRHGGIPDVVLEGETGFLVEEGDVQGMADRMLRLAADPALAGKMGRVARSWVEAEFSIPRRVGDLWKIIESCLPGPVGAIAS
jgi:glycosyltransferase involved in cell wall biosynthesis